MKILKIIFLLIFCTITSQSVFAQCNAYFADVDYWVDTSNSSIGMVQLHASKSDGTAPYTYIWDLGDGNTTSSARPLHQYANSSQSYTANVTVTDVFGCTATGGIQVMPNNYSCSDTALFTMFSYAISPDGKVQFNDNITYGASSLLYWNFGVGPSGLTHGTNPSYQFNTGSYDIELFNSTLNFCSRSSFLTIDVQTQASTCYGMDGSFKFEVNGNLVTFTSFANGGVGPYSYQWDFGDGTTSVLQHPVHTFAADGFYQIKLKCTDINGCHHTVSQPLYIGVHGDTCVNNNGGFIVTPDNSGALIFEGHASGFDNFSTYYQWVGELNNIGQTISHIGLSDGWHELCVEIGDFSCRYTHCDRIYVMNSINSNTKIQVDNAIEIAPNPTHKMLNLSIESAFEEQVQLSIFNLQGKLVLHKDKFISKGENQVSLDISALPSCVYLIKIAGRQMQASQKFVKS